MPPAASAWCDHELVRIGGARSGPLASLTFAAKDLFSVAGFRCCAGSPDWLASHPPARRTAPAIARLLAAGASLVGKTRLDELAWGMTGENLHYGSPPNPQAPGRLTGGSSSGSASVVAAATVDFALGTDTGGSVRVPASYCGIFGLRPTHGRISSEGVIALAPSFDTVGYFARGAALMRLLGEVLLDGPAVAAAPRRLLIADDAFAVAHPAVRDALQVPLERIGKLFGAIERVSLAPAGFDDLAAAYTIVQSREAWAAHGAWIEACRPTLGAPRERFRRAERVSEQEEQQARAKCRELKSRLASLLESEAFICLPAAYSVAPLPGQGEMERAANLKLTCIASLAGLPQLSLPLGLMDGLPVALSLIGPHGADEVLLALAEQAAG